MLPTELIERNGDRLRECVLSLASIWGLEEGFAAWVREACVFCSTLVDRIVSGCPPEELPSLWERLGYRDELLTVGEPFGMWAIEAPENVAARLPIDGPGSPAFFVRDLAPWKQRKVRILNGGHTSMVPAAFLAGKDLVRECMDDAVIHRFLTETEAEEIVPYVPLPRADALAFAGEVEQRFENPFLDHRLLDICANSFAKWKERVLPSVRDCYAAGKLPRRLVFSFAALLAFYTAAEKKDGELFGLRDGQPYRLQESAQVLALAERFSSGSPEACGGSRDAGDRPVGGAGSAPALCGAGGRRPARHPGNRRAARPRGRDGRRRAMNDLFRIHPEDTVAVALRPIPAGETAQGNGFSVRAEESIPQGHKIALCRMEKGGEVIKYGWPIGRAKETIAPGHWVHAHDMESQLEGLEDYRYEPQWKDLKPEEPAFFSGYRRPGGKTGVRNELWIVPMVGCVNGLARQLERQAAARLPEGVDGVVAFQHSCGCSQLGDDLAGTQKFLRGLLLHPNAGGVLALRLGCENNRPEDMQALLGDYDRERIAFLVCQDCEDELEEGLRILDRLGRYAATFRREPCPVSSLTVGLKCGGSDGLSGITANPLAGSFSDWLLARGGSAVLTEVPEMFGAERLLMNRCRTEQTFASTVEADQRLPISIFCGTASRSTRTPRRGTGREASPRWPKNRWAACRNRGRRPWRTCCATANRCGPAA